MASGGIISWLQQTYFPDIGNASRSIWWSGNTTFLHRNLFQDQNDFLSINEMFPSAAHLGLVTGVLLAVGLNTKSAFIKGWRSNDLQWILEYVVGLLCLIIAVIIAPLAGCIFIILASYRHAVYIYLKFRLGDKFAGLMEGTDTVWALENSTSLSVINALTIVQVSAAVTSAMLLKSMRAIIKERLLQEPVVCPKLLLYRKKSLLGYYYWEQKNNICIEEHVREMGVDGSGISFKALRGLVSCYSNSFLPSNHAASWEVLIGSQKLLGVSTEEGGNKFPILFRLHHSLGDGVALMQLLVKVLADQSDIKLCSPYAAENIIKLPKPQSEVEKVKYDQNFGCTSSLNENAKDELDYTQHAKNYPSINVTDQTVDICLDEDTNHKKCDADSNTLIATATQEKLKPKTDIGITCDKSWISQNLSFSTLETNGKSNTFPIMSINGRTSPCLYMPFSRHDEKYGNPVAEYHCQSQSLTYMKDFRQKEQQLSKSKDLLTFSSVSHPSNIPLIKALPSTIIQQDQSSNFTQECYSDESNENFLSVSEPIARPSSPIPPFTHSTNHETKLNKPLRIINGQFPIRPCKMNSLRKLPCYRGNDNFVTFPNTLQALNDQKSTTIYFYNNDNSNICPVNQTELLKENEYSVQIHEPDIVDTDTDVDISILPISPEKITQLKAKDASNFFQFNMPDECDSLEIMGKEDLLVKTNIMLKVDDINKELKDGMANRSNFIDHSPCEDHREYYVNRITTEQKRVTINANDGNSNTKINNKRSSFKQLLASGNSKPKNIFQKNHVTEEQISNKYLILLERISRSKQWEFQTLKKYLQTICALIFMPASLLHHTIMNVIDNNSLHGKELSGHKFVSWYSDSVDGPLFDAVKRVKDRIPGARFTDVFLTALSASLESYFSHSHFIPKCITVVIPVRMEPIIDKHHLLTETLGVDETSLMTVNKTIGLHNLFSVGLLTLPIASGNGKNKMSSFKKLSEVCQQTEYLRSSPDYHINFWLMKVAATYIPVPLLAPLLQSAHSTLVASNLVGPKVPLKLGGNIIENFVFWVPNRGSTGVGVSLLSYAGKLQLGILVDRALVPSPDDVQTILDGMVEHLRHLDTMTASFTPDMKRMSTKREGSSV